MKAVSCLGARKDKGAFGVERHGDSLPAPEPPPRGQPGMQVQKPARAIGQRQMGKRGGAEQAEGLYLHHRAFDTKLETFGADQHIHLSPFGETWGGQGAQSGFSLTGRDSGVAG